jgi:ABC-2 type transport system ATP-binding protein
MTKLNYFKVTLKSSQARVVDSANEDNLNILTNKGQVTHFAEKIPSVNDIFIQTVSQ